MGHGLNVCPVLWPRFFPGLQPEFYFFQTSGVTVMFLLSHLK